MIIYIHGYSSMTAFDYQLNILCNSRSSLICFIIGFVPENVSISQPDPRPGQTSIPAAGDGPWAYEFSNAPVLRRLKQNREKRDSRIRESALIISQKTWKQSKEEISNMWKIPNRPLMKSCFACVFFIQSFKPNKSKNQIKRILAWTKFARGKMELFQPYLMSSLISGILAFRRDKCLLHFFYSIENRWNITKKKKKRPTFVNTFAHFFPLRFTVKAEFCSRMEAASCSGTLKLPRPEPRGVAEIRARGDLIAPSWKFLNAAGRLLFSHLHTLECAHEWARTPLQHAVHLSAYQPLLKAFEKWMNILSTFTLTPF